MNGSGMNFYDRSDSEQAQALMALASAALKRWNGSFGEPELVNYRENAVFSVKGADGIRAALRVHRAGYHSDAALRSELYWMRELARAGIDVPAVMPAADGSLFIYARIADVPEPRQVDMIEWLSGSPGGGTKADLSYFRQLGELAARLHNCGSEIPLPEDFNRHHWDEDGLLGTRPIWGQFLDLPILSAEQRDLLRAASERAAPELAAYGKEQDRYGMIHADLIRDNVLEHDGHLQAIDFDDCGFGWYMFELATILCANLDRADHHLVRQTLLDGYSAIRPLSAADLERLPLFLFLRATTYLGWLQTRSETQTARQTGAGHIERCCRLARAYLASDRHTESAGEGR